MLWTLLFLFVTLVVGGLVVAYVAFPHRGQQMPVVPQLGEKLKQVADSIPRLDHDEVRAARR